MQHKKGTSEEADVDFVEGLRTHSSPKLERLYKIHFPMVLQLILNNSGSEQDAKDVYQESVLVLYERIQQGSFELNSKLKTFIYSVARRLWLKRLSKKSALTSPIHDFEEVLVFDDEMGGILEKEAQFAILQQALEHLGQPCKSLIEDFYLEGLSMEDISEKFGYTNSENAKNQKYKCLMRLKKIFFLEYTKENPGTNHTPKIHP